MYFIMSANKIALFYYFPEPVLKEIYESNWLPKNSMILSVFTYLIKIFNNMNAFLGIKTTTTTPPTKNKMPTSRKINTKSNFSTVSLNGLKCFKSPNHFLILCDNDRCLAL